MSRSWHQGRQLVAAIKETLRQHFGQIHCSSISTQVPVSMVIYQADLTPIVYGGVLFPQVQPVLTSDLTVSAFYHRLETEILATLNTLSANFETLCQTLSLTIETAQTVLKTQIYTLAKSFQTRLHAFTSQQHRIASQALILKSLVTALPTRFTQSKVAFQQILIRFSSTSKYYPVYQKPLAIVRQPIPSHRFPTPLKQAFQEKLAQKANLPKWEVKIVHVYDRVFLGQFQSLAQSDQGQLICLPKAGKEAYDTPKGQQSFYLVVGQALKPPQQVIQILHPMTESTP